MAGGGSEGWCGGGGFDFGGDGQHVHFGGRNDSRFWSVGRYWSFSAAVAAAAVSDNLRRFGGLVAVSHFAKCQHPLVGVATVLDQQDAYLGDGQSCLTAAVAVEVAAASGNLRRPLRTARCFAKYL